MQKNTKKKHTEIKELLQRAFRSNVWAFIAPAITLSIVVAAWLVFALSATARAWLTHGIRSLPEPFTSTQILIVAGILTPIALAAYFWLDYQQHVRLLRKDDPKIKYSPTHHAKKVVLPKLRYNWKQSLYWVGYGMASIFLILSIIAYRVSPVYAYAPNEFVTTWDPANDGDPNAIDIYADSGSYTYDYNVDWGDGNTDTNVTDSISHSYSSGGVYTVKITGQYPKPLMGYSADLVSVEQWGNMQWQSMSEAFSYGGNVTINAADSPDLSQVTDMSYMFSNMSMNSDISGWDTSHVQNMDQMFRSNPTFNQPIGSWDTSSLTSASYMFGSASAFNQSLDGWYTNNLTDISGMFDYASAFNQPLNSWNTSNITNITNLFTGASAFNQPLNNWDTSSVTTMEAAFALANSFDQSLGSWDVSNVANMSNLFGFGSGMSSYNYDATLINWSTLTLQFGVTLDAGSSQYCNSATERSGIISTYGWTINDSGASCAVSSTLPLVTTSNATSITGTSATLNGEVVSDNGDAITAAGFEYSTDTSYSNDTGSITTSVGTYSTGISSLSCGTTYHVRAYATNSTGTGYGVAKSFTTTTCPFITTWKTNNYGGDSKTITIPTNGGGYNYDVDWGDSSSTTGVTGDATHVYATEGTYTISITGDFPRIYINNDSEIEQKLLTVESWGSIQWGSMENAFFGASNLTIPATDTPNLTNVTNADRMFEYCDSLTTSSAINDWNVSNITSMWVMFGGAANFNSSIENWDVGNVTNFGAMFSGAASFNQPLDAWNVSGATNMYSMFSGATSFNQPLNSWNVSNVTQMTIGGGTGGMFSNAASFNQPLDAWNVSGVTALTDMFAGAASFNQPLDTWNVSAATDMSDMFAGASSFNQPLDAWNVSGVTGMTEMFYNASSFNQSLATWQVGNVTSMNSMLLNAALSTDNYDATLIAWSAQSLQNGVTLDASATYCAAATQRGDIITNYSWTINDDGENCPPDFTNAFITTWKTDNPGTSNSNQITIPTSPYGYTYNFDVDWGDTNVTTGETGSVTHTYSSAGEYTVKIIGTFPAIFFNNSGDKEKILSVEQWGNQQWGDMTSAFSGASNLHINAPDSPDLQNVTFATSMFQGASSMNEDISGWDVSNISDLSYMFYGATSFNQPIGSWTLNSSISGSGTIFMFYGATSFNQPLNSWDMSHATNLSFMFFDATSFNQPLNNWNVSNVTNMWSMFSGASSFNQDISGWSTGAVTNMSYMFEGASAFNQPIGSWSVASVNTMYSMFRNASTFNRDLSSWVTSDATSMTYMFNNAAAFNQSLGDWDVSQVLDMTNMLTGASLSTANYDATLIGWSGQSLQNAVQLDASAHYCEAEAERQSIIDDFSWSINDAGKDCADAYKQVNTEQPDKLSSSQAKLNGSVSGAGAVNFVSAGFEWGETESYGNTISSLGISSNDFNSTVTLDCDTQYHYRAFAVDGNDNKTYGENTTFTLACPTTPTDPPTDPTDPPTEPTTPPATTNHLAPSIQITAPKEGEGFETGESIALKTKASAGTSPIKEVRFYLNGKLYKTVTKAPYETSLDDAKNGVYKLIAVAEDTAGYDTATDVRNFGVSKLGVDLSLLVSKDDSSGDVASVAKRYAVSGWPATGGRNLPWVLLLVFASAYLVQAAVKAHQNKQLAKKITFLHEARDGLDGFLHIVTHYLATPVTTMTLSVESIRSQSQVTGTVRQDLEALKSYVNQLIADLNTKSSEIKNKLSYAGKVKHYSVMKWVVLPSIAAGVLLVVSILGMAKAGVWSSASDDIVFSVTFFVASVGVTFFAFRLWQHQRQLEHDLKTTHQEAKEALEARTSFITENRTQLEQKFYPIQNLTRLLPTGAFKQTFDNGVAQFHKVLTAFDEVAVLSASTTYLKPITWVASPLITKLKSDAAAKSIQLTYNGPEKVNTKMTSGEVEKVFKTLTDNAAGFTKAGDTISVNLQNQGKHLVLTVHDTGQGISNEKLRTLMQPFARGTDTETYNYEGIGLNLYIVRLIAEKYGGGVSITSQEGKHTTVTFRV